VKNLLAAIITGLAFVAGLLAIPVPASAATCGTGPYQSYVEGFLKLPVDGINSSTDCEKIASWQKDNGINPATGNADSLTYSVMKRKVSAKSRVTYCPAYNRVVCVDLTSQMMWISEYGKRVWGPYTIRSGRDGSETRTTINRGGDCRSKYSTGTADYCKVFKKVLNDWSYLYNEPMPYAMYFDGGIAFHTSSRYIYDPLGSHACVHILPNKAAWLWNNIPLGTKVHVFGRKPGT
jgi:L,D-transpeptidase catalytic domain